MKKTGDMLTFNLFSYALLGAFSLLCVFPIVLLVSGSLSTEQDITNFGFSLIPKTVSPGAYAMIFRDPQVLLNAYGITVLITAVGAGLGIIVTAMTAFAISRKDFRFRTPVTFFFYFTTLFSGGLMSTYIFIIRYMHLKNSLLALILPLLVNVFYLLVMRSFVSAIPESIVESGKIEGASDYAIFFRLILPLLKPALATIGLFLALDYWNDWSNAMLYITDQSLYPLQYMLYSMLSSTDAMSRIAASTGVPLGDMPSQSLKMAMAVVATGPVVFLYPWVQKYFVKGITVGAVKG